MHTVRRACITVASTLVALTIGAPALALTTPLPGGVALPSGAVIHLPFQNGVTVHVLSGYGPNAGSSLHNGLAETGKANDYYGLDFVLPEFPNEGLGEPVLAIAAGTVVKAGWATSGWANYGQRVIVAHDLGDGHVYHAIYCHLNAILVKEGDQLQSGQQLGELGDSCDGDNKQLSCPWFGPHLHFAIHQDSSIGGSGTGGSYAGHATVPEMIDGYEDLKPGLDLVSKNTSGPVVPCQVLPPAGGILDDKGTCFHKLGTASYWHEEALGHDGHLWWTNATEDPNPDNASRWDVHAEQATTFVVEAYAEPGFATSAKARYIVRHAGSQDTVVVDQSAGGWRTIGQYAFAAGGDQWVRLEDNTGELLSSKLKLVSDAVRFSPAGQVQPDAGGEDAAVGVDAGKDGAASLDAGTQPDGAVKPSDAATEGAVGSDGGRPVWTPPGSSNDEGCGCSTAGQPRSLTGWLVAIATAALVLSRRRGARPRSAPGPKSTRSS
ncbi:MAG: peptidoglycan DD-metalloendopeptidase family protein [Deltaproteobacteria bacterium]|nr:peptidoglycan DD-metalloendopeptidase family protein [Deltaproteobacteria bacterium]